MAVVTGSCFSHFGRSSLVPAVWGCLALGILQLLFSRLSLDASFSVCEGNVVPVPSPRWVKHGPGCCSGE